MAYIYYLYRFFGNQNGGSYIGGYSYDYSSAAIFSASSGCKVTASGVDDFSSGIVGISSGIVGISSGADGT